MSRLFLRRTVFRIVVTGIVCELGEPLVASNSFFAIL